MALSSAARLIVKMSGSVEPFVHVELEPSALIPEKQLFKDLELDSLDIVDLVSGLQHNLGISLRENKELLQIRTLQDVYELVEKILTEHPELKDKIPQK